MTEKCNMAGCMAWHFSHAEFEIQQWQVYAFPFSETAVLAGNPGVMWAEHHCAATLDQFGDASGMIRMVMRQQDVTEFQALLFEFPQHRTGIAGIDNCTLFSTCRDQPDIIVGKRRYRCDGNFGHV